MNIYEKIDLRLSVYLDTAYLLKTKNVVAK